MTDRQQGETLKAFARNLRSALRDCGGNARLDKQFIQRLSDGEIAKLLDGWLVWAREEQTPPVQPVEDDDWTTWLMLGGRGAGKTRAGAEWVKGMAMGHPEFATEPAGHIALVGETLDDVRAVMVEGVSGILSVHRNENRPKFEVSKRRLTWPNGSVAQMFSGSKPDSLRGPQFHAAWCDELCKWRYPEESWDMLQFGLRLGEHPRQMVTTTPRPIPLLRRLISEPGTVLTKMKTRDNEANLAPSFLKAIVGRYQGTRLGRQELDAEILEDRPDALWKRSQLEKNRTKSAPAALCRIVVAIDPPVTSGPRADACGIVVAAKGEDGCAYVLADETVTQARPLQWASRAVSVYQEYSADCLIAEVNQGGEMVETIIGQVGPHVPVRTVQATRGKWLRAEPVAALYEQGRVKHVGAFAELEDQMCDFGRDGLSTTQSPDRVDALVWALTVLMLAADFKPRIRTF